MMFRFENEQVLYGLLIIPVLVLLYIVLHYRTKRQWVKYGDMSLLQKLMSERSLAAKNGKFTLLMAALACFIFALANPQVGSSLEKGTQKGVDIMVCFDVSNSMLAEDVKPNRLEASKMAMSRFVDKLHGDRIGLVVFAGTAFVQLPITSDYAAAKMFINGVNTNMINEQGTDIANALDLAIVSMLPPSVEDSDLSKIKDLTSKVVIVVSDGEDHHPGAEGLAREAREMGMVVHTIGIGSTRGEPIPVTGKSGRVEYKKDNEGNTVMTRLNEQALKSIAAAGGGIYIHANNAMMGFESILDEINTMYKTDVQEITFMRYESRYQYPLLLGLLLLFVEAFLYAVKPRWRKWFTSKATVLTLVLFTAFPVLQAQTQDELKAVRQGNAKFKAAENLRKEALDFQEKGGEVNARKADEKLKEAQQKYAEAGEYYQDGMKVTRNYDKANYNLGNAYYRQDEHEKAREAYQRVEENTSVDLSLRSKALYNIGNTYLKEEKYKESIEAYKSALKLNPSDMDAKYNLAYAKKKLQEQEQKEGEGNEGQQEQQDQGDQNQNQDQNGQDKQDQQGKQQDQQGDKDQKSRQQDGQDKKDGQREQQKDQQESREAQAARRERQETDKRQLDALQQNERQTQQKVLEKQMKKGSKVPQEKDW